MNGQISDMIGKYFKVAIVNMFTVKENLIKRVKKGMRLPKRVFRKEQIEIMELKNTIIEIKVSLEKFNI